MEQSIESIQPTNYVVYVLVNTSHNKTYIGITTQDRALVVAAKQ